MEALLSDDELGKRRLELLRALWASPKVRVAAFRTVSRPDALQIFALDGTTRIFVCTVLEAPNRAQVVSAVRSWGLQKFPGLCPGIVLLADLPRDLPDQVGNTPREK